jgi:hypothetical protein
VALATVTVPLPDTTVGPDEKNTRVPDAAGVAPSLVPIGRARRFCTVTSAPSTSPVSCTLAERSCTNMFCPPTTRSADTPPVGLLVQLTVRGPTSAVHRSIADEGVNGVFGSVGGPPPATGFPSEHAASAAAARVSSAAARTTVRGWLMRVADGCAEVRGRVGPA